MASVRAEVVVVEVAETAEEDSLNLEWSECSDFQ